MRGGVVAASLLLAGTASAGGFYVPEIGARATGMGVAVTSDVSDPSATFHNPAGLAHADGLQIELATDLFLPNITFFRRPLTDPNTGENLKFDGASNTNSVIAAPFLGASYRVHDKVTAGLAVFAPFGATLEWPEDGAQRQVVTSISLKTIFASPSVGVKLPAGFSVGLAANVIYGDLVLEQRNAIPYVTGDPEQYPDPAEGIEGNTHVEGKDPFSLGATIGLGWRNEQIAVGASLMTPVVLRLEGDARVENMGIAPLVDQNNNTLQAAGAREDQVRIRFPLPLIARLGVAVKPTKAWRIGADVNWQRWETQKTLVVDFVNEHELLPTPGAYLYDVRVENRWKNTFSARLGAEATPLSAPVTLRAGVLYDQSPVGDRNFSVLTPDSDKLGLTAGARYSYKTGSGDRWDFDLAAMHLFLAERDIAPAGDGSAGSDGTILNKPAPSFFHGVTRAGFSLITLAVAWRH
ncbi:MAG: outer membrane protein transport protein [Myxococcales bacterium]|nr:outer membrane protein transport protein [Myxococcales bacterium]